MMSVVIEVIGGKGIGIGIVGLRGEMHDVVPKTEIAGAIIAETEICSMIGGVDRSVRIEIVEMPTKTGHETAMTFGRWRSSNVRRVHHHRASRRSRRRISQTLYQSRRERGE